MSGTIVSHRTLVVMLLEEVSAKIQAQRHARQQELAQTWAQYKAQHLSTNSSTLYRTIKPQPVPPCLSLQLDGAVTADPQAILSELLAFWSALWTRTPRAPAARVQDKYFTALRPSMNTTGPITPQELEAVVRESRPKARGLDYWH
eukprot:3193581-Amphidinium_carterae.1